jgi:predicted ATPase/class 3 adenylate cyclase/Flp pilus assembly protein TadD
MDAPNGSVTLVFTDVESSTVLWEKVPEAMREGLALHNDILRALIAESDGYEVKTEGDAFMVAFRDSPSACRFCLLAQQRLIHAPWPAALLRRPEAAEDLGGLFRGLRVRMGLHRGRPDCRTDPTSGRTDYFGPMVNRAARVSGAGHGGQILASAEVRDGLGEKLASEVMLTDLGEHRLKGIDEPLRLFQLLPKGLAGRSFPPIKTQDVRRTNLTVDRTDFIGRQQEQGQLAALLDQPGLVTLLGPGGMGKTRLSRQVGRGQLARFSGGVWFCDVSAAGSLDELLATVAAALGVALTSLSGAQGQVEQVGGSLAGRGRTLLIVDNVEQIIGEAARCLERWRELAPETSFLVTSRLSLELAGERAFELEPLGAAAAAELFAARAREVRHGWSTDDAGSQAVAELVACLDRIPLAIELAAARSALFSPAQLLSRLRSRLDLFKSRDRAAQPRQATLRGAIDWSWELLAPWQQAALAQCAIFMGGFSFDALEAVVGPQTGGADAMAVIESLRNSSLLRQVGEAGAELRYGMYESIRLYALEKLDSSGMRAKTAQAHALYFVGEAERRQGTERVRFVAREHENLAAVPPRLLGGDWPLAARAAIILTSYPRSFCPTDFVVGLADSAIAASPADAPPAVLAHLLATRANYRAWFGRKDEALRDMQRARDLAAVAGDPLTGAFVGHAAGMMQMLHGEMLESQRSFEDALGPIAATDREDLVSELLEGLALNAFFCGRLDEQLRLLNRALALPCAHSDALQRATLQRSLSEAYLNLGDYRKARENAEESLPVVQDFEDRETETHLERILGTLALAEGRLEEAASRLERAKTLAKGLHNFMHQAIIMRLHAVGLLLIGKSLQAAAEMEASIPILELCAVRRLEGPLYSFLGAAHCLAGDAAAAKSSFAKARKLQDDTMHWQNDALQVLEALLGPRDAARREALVRGVGLREDSVDLVLARKVLDSAPLA